MKKDWHKADIIAALHKKSTSMAALSRSVGLSSSTLANVLTRPWPKAVTSALMDFEASVFDSRLNSCIMKSRRRPTASSFFRIL
ncbi:helix-turn-helix domain-containing protein [Pectobacterium versatile]|uniref:helix-turn-helix domain-containing protein n=1 Tax=Pectobacterium versatile TaxID=2488639 RepID=UPI001F196A21|nr:helix-turn-helix domain-containing protein [Pectobacterium versatile]